MRWNIVTDSSCDLPPVDNKDEQVRVSSVPFIISVGEKDFVDDAALDTDTMLKAMEQCKSASHTSCPTPQSWIEEFEKADQNIAITISSQLSGSMNVVWNNRIDLCPDTCYINSVPACAKGLTREEMLEAKNAMLAMGVDVREENAVAGFAVSRRVLGLDRRKK